MPLTAEQILVQRIRHSGRLLVAYSGGVDSAYLLWRSYREIGPKVLGVLADSPSLAKSERQAAITFAAEHDLPLRIIQTNEFSRPEYQANPPNRCFFCKAELFARMEGLARAEGFETLAYGENADDPPNERPGSQAALAFSVCAPLREAGLGKAAIRQLAATAGLRVADKPASPCLASRIPYGQEVTREKIARVEAAENLLRSLGLRIVRVRHDRNTARIQVAPDELNRLLSLEPLWREPLFTCGFHNIEIDPAGYQGAGLR